VLQEILRIIDSEGTVPLGELERRLGIRRASLLHALDDLSRAGYLALEPPREALPGCGSACAGCRALPGCGSAVWRLTKKARRSLAAGGERT
jgi:DNA-binding IclR family transcriptional regulator